VADCVRLYEVEADADNPLRATLKGEVVIQEVYNGQCVGRAEESELRLVREAEFEYGSRS
jgi:hypothetical protein